MSKHLVISINYQEYAIPYTPEVAAALPDILSAVKVTHSAANQYIIDSQKSDLRTAICTVVPETTVAG